MRSEQTAYGPAQVARIVFFSTLFFRLFPFGFYFFTSVPFFLSLFIFLVYFLIKNFGILFFFIFPKNVRALKNIWSFSKFFHVFQKMSTISSVFPKMFKFSKKIQNNKKNPGISTNVAFEFLFTNSENNNLKKRFTKL